MQVEFGKHANMDVRRLVIKHPDYIKWVLDQVQPSGKLAVLASNVRRYIQIFDAKPLVEECSGRKGGKCPNAATRGTAYHSHSGLSVDLMWWCSKCDPYQSGAAATLISVSKYGDALSVVDNYRGRVSDYVDIIKCLSVAKGMPFRVTSSALDAFFGP